MRRQTPQHFGQRARLLARLDHVAIDVREDYGLLAHRIGQAAALHHFLPELLAHVRRNALGFEMRHALQRDGQRHAALEQVGELRGVGGKFLKLGPALATFAEDRGKLNGSRLCSGILGLGLLRLLRSGHADLRGIHHHGEKAEPFNLHQRRRAVRHIDNTLHHLPGPSFRFVGKLWHKLKLLDCIKPAADKKLQADRYHDPSSVAFRQPAIESADGGTS